CNKSVKARVQCADCSMGFCFECWSSPNRKLILGKHLEEKKGRKWTIVFPPGWSVEKGVSENCPCMDIERQKGFVMHCERCQDGMCQWFLSLSRLSPNFDRSTSRSSNCEIKIYSSETICTAAPHASKNSEPPK